MKVKELYEFIGNFSEDTEVTMLMCASDSPLDSDMSIGYAAAITRSTGEQVIVIVPK